jgi:hypothetical protein
MIFYAVFIAAILAKIQRAIAATTQLAALYPSDFFAT